MTIEWFSKQEFWAQLPVDPPRQVEEDDEFYFQMPLHDIRARIRNVPPEFTPYDECDFPGPVERYYGVIAGVRFLMTYYYHSPVPDTVVVRHTPGVAAARIVREAMDSWRA